MTNHTDLSDSLDKLHISSTAPSPVKKPAQHKKKKAEPIIDSWETASLSSDSEEEEVQKREDEDSEDSDTKRSLPKPASPIRGSSVAPASPTSQVPASDDRSERPAKTDAVARRMISAALGIRTRPTKEQREFDAALREKERKRKEEERAKKREEEKRAEEAKRSVWED
jgi:hypothetical protein